MTGAGGASATGAGVAAALGAGAAAGGFSGVIGASLMRAAEGNEAASGEGFGTTRRFARCDDGATAAESADGDRGVTPLGINAAAAAWILSAAVFSTAGLSGTAFSAPVLSKLAFSAAGLSL